MEILDDLKPRFVSSFTFGKGKENAKSRILRPFLFSGIYRGILFVFPLSKSKNDKGI